MKIEHSKDYLRTLKRVTKKHTLTEDIIDKTVTLYISDSNNIKLQLKKIKCKRDKNRHSIRIPNTQYRILMSITENLTVLQCICDHDEYDMRNKNC
jgi:plasmid maintenance system killer protein